MYGSSGALTALWGSISEMAVRFPQVRAVFSLAVLCAGILKTAQKFDSYLAAMGLNVAQTGSSMGMELLMAAR